MKRILFFTVVLLFLISLSNANATLTLWLKSGTSSVIIADQGIDDSNPNVGVITFIGGVGIFNINVVTGAIFPALPASLMDLHSLNVSSASNGVLDMALYFDSGFPFDIGNYGSPYTMTGLIGGTTAGTVEAWKVYEDASKTVILHMGPFGSGAFSATASTSIPSPNGPFRLSDFVKITHPSAGTTSFDLENHVVVPEPGTLILLGVGLVSLAVYGKAKVNRRKR